MHLEYLERDDKQASHNFGPIGAKSMVKNPLYVNKMKNDDLEAIQEETEDVESTVRHTVQVSEKVCFINYSLVITYRVVVGSHTRLI